jgi:hypothetical protein
MLSDFDALPEIEKGGSFLYSFQSFFGIEIECFDYRIHPTKRITIELIQMKLLTIETTSMEVFTTQQIQNYGCTVSVPEI